MLPEHMAVYKSRPEFIDDLLFLRQIFFRGDILCERLTNLVFSYIIKKIV